MDFKGWWYFFEPPPPSPPPEIFKLLTLPLEIPDKPSPHPKKVHKIILHSWEILRPETKTLGNSAWFFLDHPV